MGNVYTIANAKCACCHKGVRLCSPAYSKAASHLTEEKLMTTFTPNRRTLLTGTVAPGYRRPARSMRRQPSKTESNALSAGDDLSKAVSYNEKDRPPSRTAASCD